jgi:hypothetical protein
MSFSAPVLAPLDEALVLLTLASPSPAEQLHLKKLLSTDFHASEFWKKVKHNDIGPLVHLSLNRAQAVHLIPDGVRRRLRERFELISRTNAARLEHAGRLFEECRKHNVQLVVLKGVLLAETLYGDHGYKKMNDIDLFVRFQDIHALRDIYRRLNLMPLALLEGGDEEPNPLKGYHLPAFISSDLAFVVGTHWGLANPKSGIKFDYDALWKRVVPARINGHTVSALAPLDALLHLCVHFHYYKTGLKELGDFANLIRSQAPFPWDTFATLVESAGAHTSAYRPLRLVESLYKLGIPDTLLQEFARKADPFSVTDTDHLCSRPDLLLTSRSVWSSEIEKAYLAFTFEPGLAQKWHWLKTFWHRLLFPPRDILYCTNACLPGEISLRRLFFQNLSRTAREIGKGFGVAIFGFIMLKSLYELLSMAVQDLTGTAKDRLFPLKEFLGNDPEKIRRLMDSME